MPDQVYSVVSGAMRFVFAFLGCLIVLRAFFWLRKDRRESHRRLRRLPDAGCVGEWVVLYGSDTLPEGTCIPVTREGILGSVRSCDVALPYPGIKRAHLDFSFENGVGLLITPRSGCTVLVDGTPFDCRTDARSHPMVHGSVLQLGDLLLRLRLFAGVDIERSATFADDSLSVVPQPEISPVYHFEPEPGVFTSEWSGSDSGFPVEQTNPNPTENPSVPSPRPRRGDRWKGDWSE